MVFLQPCRKSASRCRRRRAHHPASRSVQDLVADRCSRTFSWALKNGTRTASSAPWSRGHVVHRATLRPYHVEALPHLLDVSFSLPTRFVAVHLMAVPSACCARDELPRFLSEPRARSYNRACVTSAERNSWLGPRRLEARMKRWRCVRSGAWVSLSYIHPKPFRTREASRQKGGEIIVGLADAFIGGMLP